MLIAPQLHSAAHWRVSMSVNSAAGGLTEIKPQLSATKKSLPRRNGAGLA
jgi:hypothetical protein